ncbi:tetratricopeptide repeat protein 23 [Nothobranchius furzeri]|uniref:Tetratricopeptide repeat domain 23 n=1 Tax=Nothobranchius furzeri TaxID=105023 RepID=A0A8C6LMS2_NOTFU|nr:tetratricopeptide repeat protein 23 [Nothobranchius furzeri]KAF7224511.1 tetratricopeptide repeat protein 23-like [Nothobranchius furzeri]
MQPNFVCGRTTIVVTARTAGDQQLPRNALSPIVNMENDQAEHHSPETSTEFPENKRNGSRGGSVFTDGCSDGPSPSRSAKEEFLMMSPEQKLQHFTCRAQASEDSQQFDACIQDLVRCVALTRLVYGDRHLKLAQAHTRLAKAYLQFKGWGQQALDHLAFPKDFLPFCSSMSSCGDERLEVLTCLLSVHLTQGGASLLTDDLEEAGQGLLKAEQVLEQLHQHDVVNQQEKIKTQLEIAGGLYSVYKRQGRPEEALNQCEKSLRLLKECNKPEKTSAVYKDMAAIEQDRGQVDQTIEHLSKAHAIAVSHSPEGLEGAQISHCLAMILSSAAEPHHNEAAGHYFEQSLGAYKKSVGLQDPAFLNAQDDFCRFLLANGRQEKCVEIQRSSLDSKRSAFGDRSSEVAETLQLIGSAEMTEGKMSQAHRTMSQCLEIQSWLYGPQHKKTKAVQKAVDMLASMPEVTEAQQRKHRRKKKSDTFYVVPSSGNQKNS